MRRNALLLGLPLLAALAGCQEPPRALAAPGPTSTPTLPAAAAPDVRAEPVLPPPPLVVERPREAKQTIEDFCVVPAGDVGCHRSAMDPFYEKLLLTARKQEGAITRITHLGDSIVAADYISATIRRRLLSYFGDAGRGFVFAGSRDFCQLDGLTHTATGWQSKSLVTGYMKDHMYGFGVAFIANGEGALSSFVPGPSSKISKVSVVYLAQPGAGAFELQADNQPLGTQSADAGAYEVCERRFELSEGLHKIKLRAVSGPLRVFGVVLENDGPGIVYDAIGQIGNSVFSMLKNDRTHFQKILGMRQPDLVIVHLGANDTGLIGTSPKALEDYATKEREFVSQVREARPEASCLLVGPQDGPRPTFPLVTNIQRRLARELGCAFWDTSAFMGGRDSFTTWIQKGYLAPDGIHPTPKGSELIGDAAAAAVLAGFLDYVERQGIPVQFF